MVIGKTRAPPAPAESLAVTSMSTGFWWLVLAESACTVGGGPAVVGGLAVVGGDVTCGLGAAVGGGVLAGDVGAGPATGTTAVVVVLSTPTIGSVVGVVDAGAS